MKQKIILFLLFACLTGGVFAQATVDVFIDGVKAGQIVLAENQNTGALLSYKKSVYKQVDKLTIQIAGKSVDGGYYRKVQVMGDDITPLFTADETVGAVGQFDITNTAVIKALKKGTPLTLFVIKTPANTKSTEAISRVYLGTLTRE